MRKNVTETEVKIKKVITPYVSLIDERYGGNEFGYLTNSELYLEDDGNITLKTSIDDGDYTSIITVDRLRANGINANSVQVNGKELGGGKTLFYNRLQEERRSA